ncbi:hypothetical protein BDA99DRAFT_576435 [Phascolomyces articulosus]|uniref:Uncharacterized protein n=1 Tax=Phascolomyces articulosus TaxID=60185 RepID=A0AAD5P9T2_9FUNG|nr:hypothetical protein BDA99DRAFT_576435 [Phascolomyces articulosus]
MTNVVDILQALVAINNKLRKERKATKRYFRVPQTEGLFRKEKLQFMFDLHIVIPKLLDSISFLIYVRMQMGTCQNDIHWHGLYSHTLYTLTHLHITDLPCNIYQSLEILLKNHVPNLKVFGSDAINFSKVPAGIFNAIQEDTPKLHALSISNVGFHNNDFCNLLQAFAEYRSTSTLETFLLTSLSANLILHNTILCLEDLRTLSISTSLKLVEFYGADGITEEEIKQVLLCNIKLKFGEESF